MKYKFALMAKLIIFDANPDVTTLKSNNMNLKGQINELLADGKIKQAIDLLLEKVGNQDNNLYDALIIKKSQYATLERNHTTGTLSQDEYTREKAKLMVSIQQIADTISEKDATQKILNPIPPQTNYFIGREYKLSEIDVTLTTAEPLMLINGVSGIGTTIALQFAHTPEYVAKFSHIAWMAVKTTLIADFVNTFSVALKLDISHITDAVEQAKAIAAFLKTNYKGKNLLIIDNANDASELEKHQSLLQSMEWCILITSRATPIDYEVMRLDELSPAQAKQLFLKYFLKNQKANPRDFENIPELDALLRHINYHTLLTELLAKCGNQKPLTIAQLYNILKTADLKHPDLQKKISAGQHADLTDKERNTVLHQYILNMFEPEKLDEQQQKILRQFAILPSEEIPTEHLFKMFCKNPSQTTEFENQLDNLQQSGWLIQNKQIQPTEVRVTYKMHNLVQDVAKQKLNPTAQNCKALIKALNNIFENDHLMQSHQ